jgi:dipeptidase E
MKLLLTSAGIKNTSIRDALVDLLGKPIAECSALCIPTGAYGHPLTPRTAWGFISGTSEQPMTGLGWKSVGVLELTALPSIDRENWVPLVRETDVLLANGGDALYLAHWVRESGLAELLPSLRDTVWVGFSAGSMVLTPRIGEDFVDWRPPSGGDEALGVVDFSIFPHVDHPILPENTMAAAEKWAAGLANPAYAIDDDTAIKVVDGAVEIVSEGHWRPFTPSPPVRGPVERAKIGAVDDELRRRVDESGYDSPDFAAAYDRFRPRPPAALVELLPLLAGVDRPRLVVDLGSGTGHSARIWAELADEVVGIEPNETMRTFAERATTAGNVKYFAASSYDTGLPDGSADLVTAAQSLQWMRPERVFPEVARILRPGGVFCAYNYVSLQTPLWEPEAAFESVLARKAELRAERGLDREPVLALTRELLAESGVFRQTNELLLHSIEYGDGERLLGFALSEGSMRTLLDAGTTEEEVGLDRLRAVASTIPEPIPWWIGYRAWIGSR